MDNQHVTPIHQTVTATGQDEAANYAQDLNAVMFAGQALIEGWQAVHAEMLAFWQSRLKDGLATGQRLIECGSPQSAFEIQLDYLKAALQAHLDQSAKVAGLLTHALTDSLMPKGAAPTRGPSGALAA